MAKLTRENVPFTQIANEVINDSRLSAKAKGVYVYLFSKPDNWQFSSDRMQNDFSDGKRAILSALSELEKFGYLSRKRLQSGKMEYYLAHSQNAKTALGESVPKTLKPLKAETAPINNKESNNNNKELFDWNKTAAKMQEKEGSDMDIIATFLIEKKIVPANSAQLTGYIKRYRKVAKEIEPFVGKDFKKFWTAIDMCKEESFRLGYQWNLETVYKKITKI